MQTSTRPITPLAFFALTYALSWVIWIPLALSHFGVGPFQIPEETSSGVRLLGVLMPAVAAILLSALTGGRAAVGALLKRLTLWRVGWRWWVAAALVYPLLLVAAGLIYNLLDGQPPVAPAQQVTAVALLVNVVMLSLATLGEEIGWRGVALPALQRSQSPLAASLVLGFLWAAWHLPFWLLLDTFDQYGLGYFGLNFLFIVPATLFITWVFNHTRASLLLPVVFHVVFNIVNVAVFPVTPTLGAFEIFIGLQLVAVIGVFVKLSREQEKPAISGEAG